MTQYYAKVEKPSGIMAHGQANVIDDPTYPVNTDELAIVPVTDEIVSHLVGTETPTILDSAIDWSQTHWDFSSETWTMVYIPIPDGPDPIAIREQEQQARIAEAQLNLRIVDLPQSLKTQLNNYIQQLSNIKIDETNYQTVVFPGLPF